jgi:tRNA (pseudouridine54-N1)-methyltransferase
MSVRPYEGAIMDNRSNRSIEVDPFRYARRNYVIIAHRALSDGTINLKDLCGASGRWDGIARCITAGLFISHDMRRDTAVHIVLLGPSDPPKVLSLLGGTIKYLNPDERASSALMKKNLSISIGNVDGKTVRTSPGIYQTRGGLETILDRIEGKKYLLHEDGDDLFIMMEGRKDLLDDPSYFFLSDDQEFREDEIELLEGTSDQKISIGPKPLHSYQVMIIINNILDRYT